MRAIDLFKKPFNRYTSLSSVNRKEISTLVITLLLLIAIPVTVVSVRQVRNINSQAQLSEFPVDERYEADFGCSFEKVDVEQVSDVANKIAHGKVKSVNSFFGKNKNIYSRVTIEVEEVFKDTTNTEVQVITQGGQIGDIGQIVGCDAKFAVGEEVLVFLEPNNLNVKNEDKNLYRVSEGFQGKFRVSGGLATRGRHKEKPQSFESVKRKVKVSNDGSSFKPDGSFFALTKNIISEIFQFTNRDASAFSLDLRGFSARWWPEDIPVKMYMDDNPYSSVGSASYDLIRSGYSAWAGAGAPISHSDQGIINQDVAAGDGKNVVIFKDIENRMTSSQYGLTLIWFNPNQNMIVNGTSFHRIIETDSLFNDGFGFSSTSVAAIGTHELGHTLGLGHSEFSDAIMYWIGPLWRGASLHQDDINGVNFIYPTLPNVTLSGRVTNATTGAGISGVVVNSDDNPCGNLSGTATTNSNGDYSFNNVSSGTTFCIRGPTVSGYTGPSTTYECQTAGVHANPDSCGLSLDFPNDNAFNFTYTPVSISGSILGRIWRDDNGNGTRESGEPYIQEPGTSCSNSVSIAGFGVQALSFSYDKTFKPNLCNPEAHYMSDALDPGNYWAIIVKPAGWEVTGTRQEANDPAWTVSANKTNVSGNLTAGLNKDIWFGVKQLPTEPDLTASSLSQSIASPVTGNNMIFSGNINNSASAAAAGASKARFCIDNSSCRTSTSGRIGSDVNVTSLNPGASDGVASSFWTATFGSHTAYLCANVGTSPITESTTSNNCTSKTFTVVQPPDTQRPTVNITSPSNNSYVSGTLLTVSAHASDNVGVTEVEFFLDGVKQKDDFTSPYSWSWNTTQSSDGSHTLTAKAYDAAGNTKISTAVNVTVDNTNPSSAVITSPANGAVLKDTITISASASDNIGVSFVEFIINGIVRSSDSSSPYTYSWNTNSYPNGPNTIQVKAWDNADNTRNSSTITVTVDNQNPTLTITNPSNGATVSDTVNVTVSASDGHSGIDQVEFLIDGSVKKTDPSVPYSFSWDTTIYSNGSHTVAVNAWDNAGNFTTKNITVTVNNVQPDTQAPSTPTGLSANAVSPTQVNLTWNASTDNIGVVVYKVYRNGVHIASPSGTSFGDGTVNADTTYTYRVSAVDAAGNESIQSTPVTVTTPNPPDTQNPVVTITAPVNGVTVSGVVNITATATDNVGVTGMTLFIDGQQKAISITGSISYSWDTTTVANGIYIILVNATDAAGNPGTSQISVVVDNQAPPPLEGDINNDGEVNIFDASIMTAKWGTNDPVADINGDGVVNIFDASILTKNWTG